MDAIVWVNDCCWVICRIQGSRASNVSTASIVSSFMPIVVVLTTYWILGEVPTRAQYGAGSTILVGIILGQIGIQRLIARIVIEEASSMQERQSIDTRTGSKGI